MPWVHINLLFISKYALYIFCSFYVIGKEEKLLSFKLTCQSIVAKLESSLKTVDFDEINVLSPHHKSVEIINSSPLDVAFKTSLVRIPMHY